MHACTLLRPQPGVEQAVGQGGRMPLRFRCNRARLDLCPRFSMASLSMVRLKFGDQRLCWSTQCLQIILGVSDTKAKQSQKQTDKNTAFKTLTHTTHLTETSSKKTIIKTFHRIIVDSNFDYRYILFHMRWA